MPNRPTKTSSHTLFAIGGAHLDRRGICEGSHQLHASNPGHFTEEPGGGVFNAVRMARNFGINVSLANVRGGDATADIIEQEIARRQIEDLPLIHLHRATPSYTAIMDEHGDLVTAIADMRLYEKGLERHVRHKATRQAAQNANACLFDCNANEKTCADIAAMAAGKPLYAMAISPAKVQRLKPCLPLMTCLFMNRCEATALLPDAQDDQALITGLRTLGLPSAIITDGANPVLAFNSTETLAREPKRAESLVDVTGAGDAFAGAFIANAMQGKDFATCLDWGLTASYFTIMQPTTAPLFDPENHYL